MYQKFESALRLTVQYSTSTWNYCENFETIAVKNL